MWDSIYKKHLEKGKTTETESRSVVAWVGSGIDYKWQEGSFEVMELFQNWIVVMAAQLLTFTKTFRTVCLKWMSFMET